MENRGGEPLSNNRPDFLERVVYSIGPEQRTIRNTKDVVPFSSLAKGKPVLDIPQDAIIAQVDSMEERFSALQRYLIDCYGEGNGVSLQCTLIAAALTNLRAEIDQVNRKVPHDRRGGAGQP